jgi:hypothetical protein
MKLTKRMCLLAMLGGALLRPLAAAAQSPWEKPAAELADQIAAILGPGQAHLTIGNLSSVPNDEIPAIRGLLTQDLKAHGVVMAGVESANAIRVTLSESVRERILVAEVGEGTQSQVAMVDLGPVQLQPTVVAAGMMLRSQQIFTAGERVLAVLENNGWLLAVEPEALVLYGKNSDGWKEQKRLGIDQRRGLARDPRSTVVPAQIDNSNGFVAFDGAVKCSGVFGITEPEEWPAWCANSDDPWPIAVDASGAPQLKAFYNSARDYFTGVVSPSAGVDLPPFYSAALLPRAAGSGALLIGGIDGKAQLAENGALNVVAGTRDWGSDFAVLHSGCGAGVQVIASSSGEATSDSLRAYELPALEAVPASAPLAMDGTVTALSTAPDGKSVLAVVRNAANQYEVDRVTALCN